MKPKIWVLTTEYNDYDQHGEYFVAAFLSKPGFDALLEIVGSEKVAERLLAKDSTGGRIGVEHQWWYLREFEEGEVC
jgi:hypothetical protein